MKMYLITAWVLGEKVTLFHRPTTRKTVDEWMQENENRLFHKGFNRFEIDSYDDE